ncbi:hypothetical protein [Paenibacillus alkalitolerans]|uniref:hypothetical protein n=1 Tax=Paenibacillus alkalitolerans TaxID=2799335 RepID=UPI0018F42EF0|nr:hypothetical protein [Paenibacillus alkalitolerans]
MKTQYETRSVLDNIVGEVISLEWTSELRQKSTQELIDFMDSLHIISAYMQEQSHQLTRSEQS